MEAVIIEESGDFVLCGELQDDLGYSPDAELFRASTLREAEQWAQVNGYLVTEVH